jgi:hypothetical protein
MHSLKHRGDIYMDWYRALEKFRCAHGSFVTLYSKAHATLMQLKAHDNALAYAGELQSLFQEISLPLVEAGSPPGSPYYTQQIEPALLRSETARTAFMQAIDLIGKKAITDHWISRERAAVAADIAHHIDSRVQYTGMVGAKISPSAGICMK